MNLTPTTNTTSRPAQKWLVLLAVGIGTFMSALDSSVVNVILPVIRDYFHDDTAAVEWVVVIYLLVVSGLLLTFGRLGDLRGNKRIYLTGFLFFLGASALCGLASSTEMLVISRGLQALGAAMLFANSPAILTKSFPAAQRGQALGMQATMTYLGLTAGPSLGGWLAQTYGWRAVFYINVPIGILAFILSLVNIPAEKIENRTERFDVPGAALFSAGLVLLMFGLNQGSSWGWGSPAVIGSLAGAAALLGVFLWVEARSPAPMLDLSLFGIRVFSASTASAVLNYICMYHILFLMPFYLLQGRGLSPAQAGLLLTAQPIVMALAAPISGSLSDRIGSRLLAPLGMGILAAGLLLLSFIGPQTPYPVIALYLAVAGLGTGIFISPNTSALMGSAPRQRQGIASGILATARNVGMVLGVGLAGAVLTSHTVQPGAEGLFAGIATGFRVAAVLTVAGVFVALLRGGTTASK